MSARSGGPLVSQPVDALPGPSLRQLRDRPTVGLSRRAVLRGSIAGGLGLLVAEWSGGLVSFLWSAVSRVTPSVRVGTLDDLIATNQGLPIREGFPAYVPAARGFVILLDPGLGGFRPGVDETGDGTALNVRALSQVCPHLGCRPNPCVEDFWFHCPCHQSRYDRKGTKPAGSQFGPAQRSMDRYAIEVDGSGVLTVHTGRLRLGPLPVALGQPGVIPAKVPNGCA
jgi:nitrite reductase/ring-hydroxylating ferredoxin subunit